MKCKDKNKNYFRTTKNIQNKYWNWIVTMFPEESDEASLCPSISRFGSRWRSFGSSWRSYGSSWRLFGSCWRSFRSSRRSFGSSSHERRRLELDDHISSLGGYSWTHSSRTGGSRAERGTATGRFLSSELPSALVWSLMDCWVLNIRESPTSTATSTVAGRILGSSWLNVTWTDASQRILGWLGGNGGGDWWRTCDDRSDWIAMSEWDDGGSVGVSSTGK